jgi:methyl-accepting chemotaxis protein
MSFFRVVNRKVPAIDLAASDAAMPNATSLSPDVAAVARRNLLDACELIEAELQSANSACVRQSRQTEVRTANMLAGAQAIVADSAQLASLSAAASQNVGAVAAATEEMSMVSREIAKQAALSSGIARQAVSTSDEAMQAVAVLDTAAAAIDQVVSAIAAIASRTNLLALNATIEAARAGEAGRGFSVVAAEVKELSRQTASATKDIAARLRAMQQATSGSVTAIQSVGSAVREMDAANSSVAAAIEQQEAALREISGRLQGAAANSAAVDETTMAVAARGRSLEMMSQETEAATTQADARAREMHGNVLLVLRRMSLLGQSWNDQVPIQSPCACATASWSGDAFLLEVSTIAALVRIPPAADAAVATLPPKSTISLTLADGVVLNGEIAAYSNGRALVMPPPRAQNNWAALGPLIERIRENDERFTYGVMAGAARIIAALESALGNGTLTMQALFDTSYKAVPGSNPVQFVTSFTEAADRLLQPLLDDLLAFDPKVVGVFVVDSSGYAPTHNACVSHQQRPDDPAWNARNCRNRRLFDDRAGLAAALSTRPTLLQSYERDMGDGERMMIKEADAPIDVRGRHWGALRMMFKN